MNTRNALALAIALARWHGGTIAQQGPRFGVAPPAPAPQLMPVPRRVVVIRPAVLISPYAQAGSHYHSPNSTSTRNATPVRGPYMVGSGQWVGQWVPSGVPANALALQWQPGDTMPSAAAALRPLGLAARRYGDPGGDVAPEPGQGPGRSARPELKQGARVARCFS